jgi:hypothetical protein
MCKKFMVKVLFLFLMVPLTVYAAGPLPLKDYQAKNADEEAIKNVLLNYVQEWNNYDKEGVLSCLHEDAQCMVWANSGTFTKDDLSNASLKKMKPRLWHGFYDPKMNIEADKGVVNATLITGHGTPVAHEFHMLRGTDRWLIMKVEYTP